MIYFYRRAGDACTCETRLQPDGSAYELVVAEGTETRVEAFEDSDDLFTRQHEIRQTWFMHGWRAIDPFDDDDLDENSAG